jgi:hypothetical protein
VGVGSAHAHTHIVCVCVFLYMYVHMDIYSMYIWMYTTQIRHHIRREDVRIHWCMCVSVCVCVSSQRHNTKINAHRILLSYTL